MRAFEFLTEQENYDLRQYVRQLKIENHQLKQEIERLKNEQQKE